MNREVKRALGRIAGQYIELAITTFERVDDNRVPHWHAGFPCRLFFLARRHSDPHSSESERLYVSGSAQELGQLRRYQKILRKDQWRLIGPSPSPESNLATADDHPWEQSFNRELPECDISLKPLPDNLRATPAHKIG